MKISQLKISNFRGYSNETTIDFDDLTAFVGKNDAGKSTILEALDIFFNEGKGAIKIDKEDINIQEKNRGNTNIVITIVFKYLLKDIVIDSTNTTTLEAEYLLNGNRELEIVKKYPNAGKEKVVIKAMHPSNPKCAHLLLKKQKELQTIVNELDIDCDDKTKNAVMRKAIWKHYSDAGLQLKEVDIDATKEDAKNIWDKLKEDMPLYSLFQSDRKNSDGDDEIQDPMKLAVREILQDDKIRDKLNEVSKEVSERLKQVADKTLEKLKEMDPKVAGALNPLTPPPENLKWSDVFKNVSISGDEGIPINKHGSGVKRLILLNFFRAEAERRRDEKSVTTIIYALEEPETSQHPEYQRKLIDTFIALSKTPRTQIILTTHSPSIVKMFKFDNLKLVEENKNIIDIKENNLPYPSLNEVNFLAFDETTEEYHNELYGFIQSKESFDDFKQGKQQMEYIQVKENKVLDKKQVILTDYIRHKIHHPENEHNVRFTDKQLYESIELMREFIKKNKLK